MILTIETAKDLYSAHFKAANQVAPDDDDIALAARRFANHYGLHEGVRLADVLAFIDTERGIWRPQPADNVYAHGYHYRKLPEYLSVLHQQYVIRSLWFEYRDAEMSPEQLTAAINECAAFCRRDKTGFLNRADHAAVATLWVRAR